MFFNVDGVSVSDHDVLKNLCPDYTECIAYKKLLETFERSAPNNVLRESCIKYVMRDFTYKFDYLRYNLVNNSKIYKVGENKYNLLIKGFSTMVINKKDVSNLVLLFGLKIEVF